jgi:hypothetical protein
MDIQQRDVASNVLAEVLEEFAFMFIEPEPDGPPPELEKILCAEISFAGQKAQGIVGLAFSWGKCLELANNLVGTDSEDTLSDKDIANALEELVNIICGRLIAEIYGTEVVFDLSIPKAVSLSQKQWQHILHSEDTLLVYEEDEPVALYLRHEHKEGSLHDQSTHS